MKAKGQPHTVPILLFFLKTIDKVQLESIQKMWETQKEW